MITLTYCSRCEMPNLGLTNHLCVRCIVETDPDRNFVEVSRTILRERCHHFQHPLQFKIVLKEIMSLFSEVYPPHLRRSQIHASTMKYEITRVWAQEFKKKFKRTPYPAEMYDTMERSATPWVDWEERDRQELETLTALA